MIRTTQAQVEEFLRQSNLIEDVDSEQMLDDAFEAWYFLMGEKVLTPSVILQTHKILMRHSDLTPDEQGYFRTIDVWVGDRKGANPAAVPMLIQQQFCFETMRVSPRPDWKALHVKYEQIHPFVDGNGRTGRLFMNWTRIRRCNLPLLTIRADERQDYYKWFDV